MLPNQPTQEDITMFQQEDVSKTNRDELFHFHELFKPLTPARHGDLARLLDG